MDLGKSLKFAEKVKLQHRSRIQFLEEPCKTREESRQFAAQTGINIAWDESVREPDFLLEKEPHLSAIVIKHIDWIATRLSKADCASS